MKRLFTLAIIAMIASLTFAQAPVQKKAKATDRKIEKVMSTAQLQKGIEAKKMEQAKAEKANAAQETSGSVLRHAAKRPTAAMQKMVSQKVIPNSKVTRQFTPRKQFKDKRPAASRLKSATKAKATAKLGAAKAEGDDYLELTADDYSADYYASDGDWFCVLQASGIPFRFDIVTNDPTPLNGTYTFDQMDHDYSWAGTQAAGWEYTDATFTVNADASEAEAYVTLDTGEKIHITYTKPQAIDITNYETYEFSVDQSTLVDYTANQGVFQVVGDNGDQYAALAFYSDQIAGTYTIDDVYGAYTNLYLTADDYDGVKPFALNATVTEDGATVIYDAVNGTEYTLIFHFTEGGDEPGGDDPQPSTVTATKDANGIITSVEGGTPKYYQRSGDGTVYFISSQQVAIGNQSGVVEVIEDGDKVYIKDPVARFTNNTWVEGTKVGNTIVVPTKQPMYYSSQYKATVSLRWGVVTTEGDITADDSHGDTFVYNVDGDTWTLQGTAAYGNVNGNAYFMGAMWDDDNSMSAGECETVLNYDPEYVAPSTDLVVLPAGANVEGWKMNATSVTSTGSSPITNQDVNVAFVGNDVYVQGVFSKLPTAWIKGTKSGSTVKFDKFQYIGNYNNSYDMYFIGTDGNNMLDATASISADGKTITFVESLLANAATDRIYYLTWLENVVLGATPAEEPVITDLTAELPYVNTFETEAEKAEAAIYDANGDGKTWSFSSDTSKGTNTIRYTYHSSNNGDDYVVFPGLALEAGKSYKVSVEARSNSAYYPERIEVVAGTVAKASELTTVLVPSTDLTTGEYVTLTTDFTPETDGTYYIALHSISDADNFYLWADNFSVKENNMEAPAAPTELTVIPDANAALKAEVSAKAPALTLSGNAIDGNVTMTFKRDGEVVNELEVAAGEVASFVDETVPSSGSYTYSVTATVGEITSDPASVQAYIGEDLPNEVANLTATDLNGKVGLEWEAPTEGANGGILIPENLKYNVYPVEMFDFFGMQFPEIDFDNPYQTGVTETSAIVDFDTNAGDQQYTYFGVTTENTAGETMGVMSALLTGAPYDIPVNETFDGGLSYWWGVDYDDNIYDANGGAGLTQEGEIIFDAPVAGWITLMSGKIALNGAEHAGLTFDLKGAGNVDVFVYGPAGNPISVKNIAATAEYTSQSIDIASLSDQPWVRFEIKANFAEAGQAYIDNINVMDLIANDLELAVSAPAKVVAGKSATVKATVKNQGTAEATDYTVKFYVNGEEVEEITDVTPLGFFETASYSYTLETTVFDEAGDVTVKAEVVYAADEKDANNADETVIEITASTATPVTEVTAEQNEEGAIVVNWTVNEDAAKEVTEDFESVQAPAAGLTFKDGETYGDWKAVDESQSYPYAWSSSSVLWDQEESFGFGIINFAASGLSTITPTSGEQAAVFISEYDESGNGVQSSKYMISPELPGIAQTISFMAKTTNSAEYGDEVVEIMASSTDSNVESFTKVTTLNINSDEGFSEFTVDLPEGTKYFALHYVSNDVFALFIDDLTYTVGGGSASGFNVYVDGNLVGTADADADSYTYTDELSEGEHEVSVTAVYGDNESAPITTTVSVATAIKNISLDSAAEIFTVDGIRLNNVKNLKSGVYVVNGKKVVIK